MFLTLAFLFFVGSVSGWVLELFFRRYFSKNNPEKKWINPGFCTGPYLPLYGCGLCMLYLIASMERLNIISNQHLNKAALFCAMAFSMTAIEYIAGIINLKISKVRLWDYSNEWGNIQGIICPKFSVFWAILGALYYFLIHSHIISALTWFSQNLAFSFVIGLFFGVFIIDVAHSTDIMVKLKKFADENEVVVRYEAIKVHIRAIHEKNQQKYNFFRPFRSEHSLAEHLKELRETFEKRTKKHK